MRAEPVAKVSARAVILRRQLSHGAIAGTVVGVVFAVGLLLLCLYPLIAGCIRCRWYRRSPSLDAENAVTASAGQLEVAPADDQRQVLSTDSLKRGADLSHRHSCVVPVNEKADWASRNGGVDHNRGLSRQISPSTPKQSSEAALPPSIGGNHLQSLFSATLYPRGEYMPELDVHHDHPSVLQGTSAEYYSPVRPFEDFNIEISHPPDVKESYAPPTSQKSPARLITDILRRKSSRNRTSASIALSASPCDNQSSFSGISERDAQMVSVPAQTITSHVQDLMAISRDVPGGLAFSGATEPSYAPPLSSSVRPSQVQWPLYTSPSSLSYPASGTVNPMDIMPANTESEFRYRTEHEILAASHGYQTSVSPEVYRHLEDENSKSVPSIFSLPPSAATNVPVAPNTQIFSTTDGVALARPDHDAAMTGTTMSDTKPVKDLGEATVPEFTRHPSDPPLRGPGSTSTSSRNSPSSQVDNPAPESLNSSDFRHSVSPQTFHPSPKPSVFPCDEPGCQQVFDQPYKLKHHRYHSKDHKCPYSSCGKGFGTVTHLQRHINDRHEKKKRFHCSAHGCDYSRAGGKAFQRKDNWKRHMPMIHDMERTNLPEPVEVDQQLETAIDA